MIEVTADTSAASSSCDAVTSKLLSQEPKNPLRDVAAV
jgi:hypothetical protein